METVEWGECECVYLETTLEFVKRWWVGSSVSFYFTLAPTNFIFKLFFCVTTLYLT